jgi:hypothetical protein
MSGSTGAPPANPAESLMMILGSVVPLGLYLGTQSVGILAPRGERAGANRPFALNVTWFALALPGIGVVQAALFSPRSPVRIPGPLTRY